MPCLGGGASLLGGAVGALEPGAWDAEQDHHKRRSLQSVPA